MLSFLVFSLPNDGQSRGSPPAEVLGRGLSWGGLVAQLRAERCCPCPPARLLATAISWHPRSPAQRPHGPQRPTDSLLTRCAARPTRLGLAGGPGDGKCPRGHRATEPGRQKRLLPAAAPGSERSGSRESRASQAAGPSRAAAGRDALSCLEGAELLPVCFPPRSRPTPEEHTGRALLAAQLLPAERRHRGRDGEPPVLPPQPWQPTLGTSNAPVPSPGAGQLRCHTKPHMEGSWGRSQGWHGRRDGSAGATRGSPGAAGTGQRGGQEDTRQRHLSVTPIINASPLHFANTSRLSLSSDKWPL